MSEKTVTPEEHEKLELLKETPIEERKDENYCSFFPHKKVVDSLEAMLSKDNTVKNKTILLTGRWGTGKSSILNLLKERQSDKTYIEYDAWITTPDMILREFLHIFFKETNNQELSKQINTVEKEVSNILTVKNSILTISLVFIGMMANELISSPIIMCIVILIIIIGVYWCYNNPDKIKSIDKKLATIAYKPKHSTEYAECADITPRKMNALLKEYKNDNKDIIIIVDNLDRLSEEQQKNYIDALYTFDKALKDTHIKVTTIIAIDKAVFLNHKSINISYFDKISPYEISLPELDFRTVNLYFKTILRNNIHFINSMDNNDQYMDLLIDTYTYFKNGNYPDFMVKKYPSLEYNEYLSTPRLVKKVYNQTVILYNNWIDTLTDSKECLKTCFLVACSRVFNQEQPLSYQIEQILISNDSSAERLNPLVLGVQEKNKDGQIITVPLFDKHNFFIAQIILTGETIPSIEKIKELCSKSSFKEYLENYINTFGLNSPDLQKMIRGALLEYKSPKNIDLGLSQITTLRIICEKRAENYSIFTDSFCSKLLKEIFADNNYLINLNHSELTIETLILLFIHSLKKEDYQNKLHKILENYIMNYNSYLRFYRLENQGKALFTILKYFNRSIESFDNYHKLHDLVKEYLIKLITLKTYPSDGQVKEQSGISGPADDGYSSFRKLSSELRASIWKLIPADKIGEYINGIQCRDNGVSPANKAISTNKAMNPNNKKDLCTLLLDLYMFRTDIHNSKELSSLFQICHHNDPKNYCLIIILLMEKEYSRKSFTDIGNMLATITPNTYENYCYVLINTKKLSFSEEFYKNLLNKIAEIILENETDSSIEGWFNNPISIFLYTEHKEDFKILLEDIMNNYKEISIRLWNIDISPYANILCEIESFKNEVYSQKDNKI